MYLASHSVLCHCLVKQHSRNDKKKKIVRCQCTCTTKLTQVSSFSESHPSHGRARHQIRDWSESGRSRKLLTPGTMTHAGRAASSPEIFRPFLTVRLTVFRFEFRPRTFTIGFYGKKSFISELMILECSFPLMPVRLYTCFFAESIVVTQLVPRRFCCGIHLKFLLLSQLATWDPRSQAPCLESEHISNIILRQQFKLFVLKRLARRRGAEDVVKRLHVGPVRPAFEYASALWDGCLRRDRIALERLQLAIARSVLHCPCQDRHNWEVLRQIGWPNLGGVVVAISFCSCGTCWKSKVHLTLSLTYQSWLLSAQIIPSEVLLLLFLAL